MAKSLHQALFLFLLCTGLAFLHELARAAPISLSTKHTDIDLLSVSADQSQLAFHTSPSSAYPAPVYLSAGLVRFQPEHFANDPIDSEPTWHESPSDYVTLERRFDLGGWFRNAFHKVGEAFKTAGQKIKEGFQKVGEGIKHVAQKVGDGIKTAANKVKEGFQTAGRKIKEGFQTAGTKIKEGFQTAGKKIKEGFQTAGRKMKEGFQTAGRWIKDTGAKVAKFGLKVAGTITAVASHIVRFIPGVGTAASAALKGATFGLNKASDAIHADLGDKLNKGMHVMDIIQDPIGYAVHKAAEGAVHHVENHIQAHKPGAPHPAPPYVHHASQDPHHNPPPGYHDPHHPPPYHVAVPGGAAHHPVADHHQAPVHHPAPDHHQAPVHHQPLSVHPMNHPAVAHLHDPGMHFRDYHSAILSHEAQHGAAHHQAAPQHHEAQHHTALPPQHHEAQHHAAAPAPVHHEAQHHAAPPPPAHHAAPPPPAHHPAPAHHH